MIQLRQLSHVLPWFRFEHAEGTDGLIEITFATHSIAISGQGLAVLLEAIAAHQVVRIIEPTEKEARFSVRGANAAHLSGPQITGVVVTDLTVEDDASER